MKLRLKDLREDNDLRQCDVARITGIDQRTISNYETGKTVPDAYALEKFANLYNVSIDYLVGRTNVDFFTQDKKEECIDKIIARLEDLKKYF